MRRTSPRIAARIGGICAALLCAASSHASTMEVRYRLDGEYGYSIPVIGFGQLAPAQGVLRLAYPTSATGPLSSMGAAFAPLPGPVALLSGRFDVQHTEWFSAPPDQMAVGGIRRMIHFELAPALGTLRPAGTLLLSNLMGHGSGMQTCASYGHHCEPETNFVPQPVLFDFTFDWNAASHLVGTSLRAAAFVPKIIQLDLLYGLRLVTAREIDRHLVPEPGSLPLAAGGFVGLALLAARRRRAHR